MLIAKDGSGTAKESSMVFQPPPPVSSLVPEDPSGAWILGRRAAPESAPPPAGSAPLLARRGHLEMLSLDRRRTPREAGHRARPPGRIFFEMNIAKREKRLERRITATSSFC